MIAYSAMVVGPGIVGGTVASADGLLGIDLSDIFCHGRKKCDKKDRGLDIPGVSSNRVASIADVPVGIASTGGGGAPPSAAATERASNLPPVPTAPSARSVVIRAEAPVSAPAAVAPAPIVMPPEIAVPVAAPLAPPAGLPPGAEPAPAAPVPPVLTPPPAGQFGGQPLPTVAVNAPATPQTFRVGYPEVLRSADMGALIIATLPGVSGMVALTAFGGLLGFRQAKAAQAVRTTAIARFMR